MRLATAAIRTLIFWCSRYGAPRVDLWERPARASPCRGNYCLTDGRDRRNERAAGDLAPRRRSKSRRFSSASRHARRSASLRSGDKKGVADYLIAKSLNAGTVPSWITDPYRRIHEDEAEHGNYPFEILVKYATTPDKQERAERAVAMSLVLRRAYFDNLDRWVLEGKSY
jgi:hypothetical protein